MLRQRLQVLLWSFFVFQGTLYAQYTDIINSNRPGASHGAYSVGKNVLQLEFGVGFNQYKHRRFNDSEVTNFEMGLDLRYGLLWEQLEISWESGYIIDQFTNRVSAVTQFVDRNGFTKNRLGAKYLFFDPYKNRGDEKPNLYSWKANNTQFRWKDLIPAMSVFVGANIVPGDNPYPYGYPFSEIEVIGFEDATSEPTLSPKVMLLTQSHFAGTWVLVTNIYCDRITTDFPEFGYIISITHAFNARWSAYLENQGTDSDVYSDLLFRGGAAYLLSEKFQLDVNLGFSTKDSPSRFLGNLGVSYRFDWHKDE